MLSCNSWSGALACRVTTSFNRAVLNSSSAGLLASVTPSLNSTRVSPGCKTNAELLNVASGRSPTGKHSAGKADSALPSRRSRGEGCPALMNSKRRSEEHTSELQSLAYLVCRLLLEKKKKQNNQMLV